MILPVDPATMRGLELLFTVLVACALLALAATGQFTGIFVSLPSVAVAAVAHRFHRRRHDKGL